MSSFIKGSIRFSSEQVTFSVLQKKNLQNWVAETITNEGFVPEELNFTFCNDKHLHTINKKFLKHSTYTDIITFDYSKDAQQKIKGEIFISIERVKENAKKFKSNFQDELHRVIIHGVLHLCEHDDTSPLLKKQMTKKEDYYLSLRDF